MRGVLCHSSVIRAHTRSLYDQNCYQSVVWFMLEPKAGIGMWLALSCGRSGPTLYDKCNKS